MHLMGTFLPSKRRRRFNFASQITIFKRGGRVRMKISVFVQSQSDGTSGGSSLESPEDDDFFTPEVDLYFFKYILKGLSCENCIPVAASQPPSG